MIRDFRALKATAAALLFLLVLHVITSLYGRRFWLNLTDSEPTGLYKLEKFDGRIRRGNLVVLELPADFHRYVYGRGWLPKGWALFKHVGALEGDLFCVSDEAIIINGRTIGPVFAADQAGLPLPRLRGCQEVPAGHFLPVAVRIERSFDGRYMGPVSLSAIKGIARPIVTFP